LDILNHFRSQAVNSRDIFNFLEVRDCGKADDERLGSFLLRVFGMAGISHTPDTPMPVGRIREILDVSSRRRDGVVRIFEIGDRIAASYSLIRPSTPSSGAWHAGAGYFAAFGIDPALQGIGLAPLLLLEALAIARAWECPKLQLKAFAASKRLRTMYERRGFTEDHVGHSIEHGMNLIGYTTNVEFGNFVHDLKSI